MTQLRKEPSGFPGEDAIVFGPHDVDLSRSPLRGHISEETYVLGAFNPGLTRLPNGNLLMMVRVAEALRRPVREDHVAAIRWRKGRYVVDRYPRSAVDDRDPRQLLLEHYYKTLILTSISWLLPVEMSADGARILKAHYDRVISRRRAIRSMALRIRAFRAWAAAG